MEYTDCLYGTFHITDPVILTLIHDPAFMRLKGVDQAGYFEPYFPDTAFSRYEHSIGVYLLLKMYGAPYEEQVSGLLHDVSHTVFSHCIDYAMAIDSGDTQGYQDSVHESYVKKTGIPVILAHYGYSIDRILDDSRFPLKERELPDLCADRIDYSLRTAFHMKYRTVRQCGKLLSALTVREKQWVFTSLQLGQQFADVFRYLNRTYYSGFSSAVMFRTVGDYLKYALRKAYISSDDLYRTDQEVINMINAHLSSDSELELLWKKMNGRVEYVNKPGHTGSVVICKSRIVDPLVINGSIVCRLSNINPAWKRIVKTEMMPKKYHLRMR